MSVTIQSDMMRAANMMPANQKAEFLTALLEYGEYGIEPEGNPEWLPAFELCKERIDMSAAASRRGKRMADSRWGKKESEEVVDRAPEVIENTSEVSENTSEVSENTLEVVENTSEVVENTLEVVENTLEVSGEVSEVSGEVTSEVTAEVKATDSESLGTETEKPISPAETNTSCTSDTKHNAQSDTSMMLSRVEKSRVENKEKELSIDNSKKKVGKAKFTPPSVEEVDAYLSEKGLTDLLSGEEFVDYYASQGWKKANGRPLESWKHAVGTWKANALKDSPKGSRGQPQQSASVPLGQKCLGRSLQMRDSAREFHETPIDALRACYAAKKGSDAGFNTALVSALSCGVCESCQASEGDCKECALALKNAIARWDRDSYPSPNGAMRTALKEARGVV